jgi:hypothetical protein
VGANVSWQVDAEVTAVNLAYNTDADGASDVDTTDFDVRSYAPGSRFLLVLLAKGQEAANSGGTWVVEESATDGGSYTACNTGGSLAATGATAAGLVQRTVSVYPNPAKPFVKARFDPADANTDVGLTVQLLVLPRVL